MRNSKTLLSIAVATALGTVAIQANAAAPTVYGDLAVALVSIGKASAGGHDTYNLQDNVSLIGVKGDVGVLEGTKFIYDFNWIINQKSSSATTNHANNQSFTHLSMVGMDGGFGTVTLGLRDNGLYGQMVDNGVYQTNYFYIPGMSTFQVSESIKFISKASGGFQYGVQAFDISTASTGKTMTNYTAAGTYAMGDLTFGAGYTKYSEYADGTLGGSSTDTNQFGQATNTWSNVVLKSTSGISAAYKSGKLGVVAAYDMRKPYSGASNTSTINTLMLTGSYAYTDKTTFVANYSDTSQSGGLKGNVITAMVSYAPASALFYSFELQTIDSKANVSGLTGATGGDKSSTNMAVGVTYNF